ncbi:MAG: hypothetical protein LBT01_07130, partial [Spirochaetaceae bacterium]|nr:hypothetical protein [Spirochaetaceae bacterium]
CLGNGRLLSIELSPPPAWVGGRCGGYPPAEGVAPDRPAGWRVGGDFPLLPITTLVEKPSPLGLWGNLLT